MVAGIRKKWTEMVDELIVEDQGYLNEDARGMIVDLVK